MQSSTSVSFHTYTACQVCPVHTIVITQPIYNTEIYQGGFRASYGPDPVGHTLKLGKPNNCKLTMQLFGWENPFSKMLRNRPQTQSSFASLLLI